MSGEKKRENSAKDSTIVGLEEDDQTDLGRALEAGDMTCMKRLLDERADVNHKNSQGLTVLCDAIVRGKLPAVKLLLRVKADTEVYFQGITPLKREACRR
jgi:ankyrin repeat protein